MRVICVAACVLITLSSPALAKGWADFNIMPDQSIAESYAHEMVEHLNQSPKTVDELLDQLNAALDSGSINEYSMLALNMKYALQGAQSRGFGSAKLDRWRFKYMSGVCGKREIVYHTTATHANKKKLPFGFHLSAGGGALFGPTVNGKIITKECH